MGSLVVPPPPFRGALLRRAAGLWLLMRAGIVALGLLLQAPLAELVFLTAPAAGFLILLVVWLTLFDARRRGEVLFLADLGVAPDGLMAMALVPPLGAELGVRLAGAL